MTDASGRSNAGSSPSPGFLSYKRLLQTQTELLLGRGIILHCSAAVVGGGAILLTCPSGGGKSTAASLLHAMGYRILGWDNVLITRNSRGKPCAYPTMHFMYETGKRPAPAPILGIYIIEKSNCPQKLSVGFRYALFRLVRDRSLMLYGDLSFRSLKTVRGSLSEYLAAVPAYILAFNRHEFPLQLLESNAT